MKQTYGHKYVVIGIFQTGITWVSRGSTKDMPGSFMAWVRALFFAVAHATDQPGHREAQRPSGTARGRQSACQNIWHIIGV